MTAYYRAVSTRPAIKVWCLYLERNTSSNPNTKFAFNRDKIQTCIHTIQYGGGILTCIYGDNINSVLQFQIQVTWSIIHNINLHPPLHGLGQWRSAWGSSTTLLPLWGLNSKEEEQGLQELSAPGRTTKTQPGFNRKKKERFIFFLFRPPPKTPLI